MTRLLFLVCLLALPSLAGVLVDSKNRFTLEDRVLDSKVYDCDSLDRVGGKFLPEGAAYLNGNSMPFRYYRVALPSSDKPSVSVTDLNTVPLRKSLCKEGPSGERESLKFVSVDVSQPYQRDGLWMTDIRVPLYVKNGSSVALRKNFKLDVRFNATVSGVNPGKRAIARVLNPVGAARFGSSMASARKALRKAASGQTSDVTFLAKFKVGDKDVSTFSEDGLYAVPFSSIRNSLLLWQRQNELDGIPLDRICLYGASPDTLPDMGPGTAQRIPDHLFEIPIEIRDHTPGGNSADGIFNDGDTLIFVGYGNSFWKRCDRENPLFVNGKMDYFHSYSPYSFYQYFVFGYKDSGKGLRFSDKVKVPAGSGKDVDWMRYVRAEKEALLIDTYFGRDLDWEKSTGKEWFWLWHSRLDSTNYSNSVLGVPQTESLPGVLADGRQYVAVSYFPYRSVWKSYAMVEKDQVNDIEISSKSYNERMAGINFNFEVNGHKTSRSDMDLLPGGNFRMDNPGLSARGNKYSLDMLPNEFQYDRFDGYSVAYQWTPSVDSAEWLLPGAISGIIKVPAISGAQVMKFKNLEPVGLLTASNGVYLDSVSASDDIRYLAVRTGVYRNGLSVEGLPPPVDGVLKDLAKPNAKMEYLIIAPYEFIEAAKSLAKFRSEEKSSPSLPTTVVAVEDIYRQYTAGRLSPIAVRNYISYVYSVCPNLRYVLLGGLGNFDYRNISGKQGVNYIPTFEKEDGVVEDFFAVLDSGEQVTYGKYDVDIAVGRLPVSSLTEFSQYVAKAKDYSGIGLMDNSNWRSSMVFTADDAWNNGHEDLGKHALDQEEIARVIDSLSIVNNERWNIQKIYLVEYAEDANGQKKEAASDLINFINRGALFTTYYGHGSETDWAAEGLLKSSYTSRLSNKGRYTILGSFSCTVGRFDRSSVSLSQAFLTAPEAGSIVSIGAARETFGDYNLVLGKSIVVNSLRESGMTIGEAWLSTKSAVGSLYSKQRFNNERYVLMGEPVVKMPDHRMKMTLDSKIDTVFALDKMTVSGSVEGLDEGYVELVMLEGRKQKRVDLLVLDDSVDVEYDGNLIYSETVPVKMGRFSTEFITPRKISVGDTSAELSLWAYSKKNDAVGRSWIRNIVIGGVSSYADSLRDTVPPSIQINSCYKEGSSSGFSDGASVKLQSPACLQVVVEDSTALDFREEADEGISFELVGVQDPFHPWPYLEQSSKRATMRMNFTAEQYPAGKYVFKVRAQDVLGNVSTRTLNVDLTDEMESGLADVFNVPNPMGKKGTTFYFKNLASEDRDSKVNIFIYNQNGRLVRVLKNAVSGVTHWNGHDSHGRLLANGLYHYVVRSEVKATETSGKKTWTKKQKLLISR